jgi:hypothetical protein
MPNFAYTLPARALPAPGAGLSRASTAPSGPGASRAASLGRAASGPAPAAGGPGRQGSLLALYVTEPVITLVAGLLKVTGAARGARRGRRRMLSIALADGWHPPAASGSARR